MWPIFPKPEYLRLYQSCMPGQLQIRSTRHSHCSPGNTGGLTGGIPRFSVLPSPFQSPDTGMSPVIPKLYALSITVSIPRAVPVVVLVIQVG